MAKRLQWRLGRDNKAHAIDGPATGIPAWVARCQRLVTGPVVRKTTKCKACLKKVRANNPQP